MPRFATIDVGSNSVLIHIAERDDDARFEPIADRAVLSRLGEGLAERGALSPEAVERTVDALARFVALAREHGVQDIAAVGTMALRNASNSSALLERAREELGLDIQVIPGEEEARLAFLAARSSLPPSDAAVVVFDVGGGSTEFILGRGASIERRFSLDLGALHLTTEFLTSDPVDPAELLDLQRHLARAFGSLGFGETAGAIGLGGTICNLAANHHGLDEYDPDVVHGTVMDLATLQAQLRSLGALRISQRRELPGIQPKRADTILAGAAVVLAVLRALGAPSLTVSDRGLRHGLLHDRFGAHAPRSRS